MKKITVQGRWISFGQTLARLNLQVKKSSIPEYPKGKEVSMSDINFLVQDGISVSILAPAEDRRLI